MNVGNFTRMKYDNGAYEQEQKTGNYSYDYNTSSNKIANCNRCLSLSGPLSDFGNGGSVSTPINIGYSEKNDLVQLESVLYGRNVKDEYATRGMNPINPVEWDAKYVPQTCDNKLRNSNTRLMSNLPPYRGTRINRFYNLIHNPQRDIFWDFAENTDLEMKDNYVPEIPIPMNNDGLLPNPNNKQSQTYCTSSCNIKY